MVPNEAAVVKRGDGIHNQAPDTLVKVLGGTGCCGMFVDP
jgi:hypothetical protein